MATTIPTTLTVVNEADVRGLALRDLITSYVSIQAYYGFRTIGSTDIVFPCVMIDPLKEILKMDRLGKYRLQISYALYFYCQESNPDAIVSQATDIGEIFAKLFSNNALGDLNGANTSKFKQYPNPSGGYYWLTSEMSEIAWSTSFLNATQDNLQTYMRAGLLRFDIEDVVIK